MRDDAGMAKRLFDAGRAAEAYAVIDAAEPNPAKNAIELPIFALPHSRLSGGTTRPGLPGGRSSPERYASNPCATSSGNCRISRTTEEEKQTLALAASFRDPHGALEFLTT